MAVILDGALGTELERRGFNARLPLWSARALIEAPDLVRQIHTDYVRAGATVISAATFRTTRWTLAKEKLDSRAGELTKLAVRLAREASSEWSHRGGESPDSPLIRIAGCIAPLEDCYHPELAPGDEILRREHIHTAESLAEAGADLILVETQNSAREAIIAAECAVAVKLPIWVSLMPRSAAQLWNGDSLIQTAKKLLTLGTNAIFVNCCPPEIAASAVQTLRKAFPNAQLGVYPNLAKSTDPPGYFSLSMSPEEFADWAKSLLNDVQIIGGCCGTAPDHIAALTPAFNAANRSSLH